MPLNQATPTLHTLWPQSFSSCLHLLRPADTLSLNLASVAAQKAVIRACPASIALLFHVRVHEGSGGFGLTIDTADESGCRRCLTFNSSFRSVAATALQARVPLRCRRGVWLALLLPVSELSAALFGGDRGRLRVLFVGASASCSLRCVAAVGVEQSGVSRALAAVAADDAEVRDGVDALTGGSSGPSSRASGGPARSAASAAAVPSHATAPAGAAADAGREGLAGEVMARVLPGEGGGARAPPSLPARVSFPPGVAWAADIAALECLLPPSAAAAPRTTPPLSPGVAVPATHRAAKRSDAPPRRRPSSSALSPAPSPLRPSESKAQARTYPAAAAPPPSAPGLSRQNSDRASEDPPRSENRAEGTPGSLCSVDTRGSRSAAVLSSDAGAGLSSLQSSSATDIAAAEPLGATPLLSERGEHALHGSAPPLNPWGEPHSEGSGAGRSRSALPLMSPAVSAAARVLRRLAAVAPGGQSLIELLPAALSVPSVDPAPLPLATAPPSSEAASESVGDCTPDDGSTAQANASLLSATWDAVWPTLGPAAGEVTQQTGEEEARAAALWRQPTPIGDDELISSERPLRCGNAREASGDTIWNDARPVESAELPPLPSRKAHRPPGHTSSSPKDLHDSSSVSFVSRGTQCVSEVEGIGVQTPESTLPEPGVPALPFLRPSAPAVLEAQTWLAGLRAQQLAVAAQVTAAAASLRAGSACPPPQLPARRTDLRSSTVSLLRSWPVRGRERNAEGSVLSWDPASGCFHAE